ncbi:hypothetical protein [Confluentibacter lentus]|nr:hypothetical protein [Confluentibacter lentus]
MIKAIGGPKIIFTNKTPLPKEVFDKTTSVKYNDVLETGYNDIHTRVA